ncbi:MAG: trehalose-phosphatase [Bryobacteraceae bacterium]
MRYLLSRACRPTLESLAQSRTLCAFDFDGTLAPITAHPDEAGMRPQTRQLLSRLTELYPCVILSGRSGQDLLKMLQDVRVERAIGNHGADMDGAGSEAARRQVEEWITILTPRLETLPGVWVEDKGLSLAVHYRQSPRKAEARKRITEASASLRQARVYGGKQVVNLVVVGAPHKGKALEAERDRLGCDWAIYVGDDDNDEDAFAVTGNVVGVRVGRKESSHARYYLRSQAEIDDLLGSLISLRIAAGMAGGRIGEPADVQEHRD